MLSGRTTASTEKRSKIPLLPTGFWSNQTPTHPFSHTARAGFETGTLVGSPRNKGRNLTILTSRVGHETGTFLVSSQIRGQTIPLSPREVMRTNNGYEYDHFFKLLFVGPPNSGKTSIIRQYLSQVFHDSYQTTFGMQNHIKNVAFSDHVVRLSIWDSPSDPRFNNQIDFHITNAEAVFFVYDSTDPDSVAELKNLLEEFSDTLSSSKIVAYLIANKKDKRERGQPQETLPKEMISKYDLQLVSTTARSSRMIDELFERVIETLLNRKARINEEIEKANDFCNLMLQSEFSESHDAVTPRLAITDGFENDLLATKRSKKLTYNSTLTTSALRVRLNDKPVGDLENDSELKQKSPPEYRFYSNATNLKTRKNVILENKNNFQDNTISDYIPATKVPSNIRRTDPDANKPGCCSNNNCNIF